MSLKKLCIYILLSFFCCVFSQQCYAKGEVEFVYSFSEDKETDSIKVNVDFTNTNCTANPKQKCFTTLMIYKSPYDNEVDSIATLEDAVVSGAIDKKIDYFTKKQMVELYSYKYPKEKELLLKDIKNFRDDELVAGFLSIWHTPEDKISLVYHMTSKKLRVNKKPGYCFSGSNILLPRALLKKGSVQQIILDWSDFTKRHMTILNAFYDAKVDIDGIQRIDPREREYVLYHAYFFVI